MASTAEAREYLDQNASVIGTPAQRSESPSKIEMVAFVRQHAEAYVDAGWDVVTEATTDDEILKAIGRARSYTGAVNAVRSAIVEGWVIKLIETRPGEDDDEQLAMGKRFEAERIANYADATARLEGRSNTAKPPRAESRSVLPQYVEIDLTHFDAPGGLQPVKTDDTADEPEGDETEPEDGESSDETNGEDEAEAGEPEATETAEAAAPEAAPAPKQRRAARPRTTA